MNYIPEKRNTFLMISGTSQDPERKHLFVILTDKCDSGEHLIVPVGSIKPDIYYDNTTVLEAGCHPFIKKPSYVDYARARPIKSSHLIKCIEGWVYDVKAPVSEEIFKDICGGMSLSDHTPQRMINYFNANSPVSDSVFEPENTTPVPSDDIIAPFSKA